MDSRRALEPVVSFGANFTEPTAHLDLSEVISALSYALDITEGQPAGHAARSCMIGMAIAKAIGLEPDRCAALFYGLLLKDLGCSSNASKVCCLFGADDRLTKPDLKTTEWTNFTESVKYVARNAAPGESVLRRSAQIVKIAAGGQRIAREMIEIRCNRGASIARNLHLPEETAQAIAALDEHWDGLGHPDGMAREEIPLLARVMGLAQTVEVFWQRDGFDAALEMAYDRRGTWFDPGLVKVLMSLRNDEPLRAQYADKDPATVAAALEPKDDVIKADEAALDRVAAGFGQVVDAKSPWTFSHSRGVSDLAVGISQTLGLPAGRVKRIHRAALLHDIGKLGVSNLILDKPGKLTEDEFAVVKRHPVYTHQILSRVACFREFADMAAGHHERIDGKGYHLGLCAEQVTLEMRILAVADMYEALAAKRPYRQDLSPEETMNIIDRQTGNGLCPMVVAALKTFVATGSFVPYSVAA